VNPFLGIESTIFWLVLMVALLSLATYHLFTPPRTPSAPII
jgi:hypothetical protein